MAINPKITLLDLYSDPNSFQFQSKNLKYDKDIRGGGYSGQPFIKRVAPNNEDNLNTLTSEALSLDYPIRGGSYEELAAREDFARIDRFLLSYPRGKAFLDKQRGLMLSNPKIPMAKSGGLFANRAYSDGRNLMTQIADAGTGIRNPNAGEDVFVLERFENKYEYVTATTPTKENRLVLLKQFKLLQPPQTTASSINQLGTIFQSLGDTVSNLVNQSPSVSPNVDAQQERAAFNYGINTVTTGELFNYTGGPGSLYGIVNNTLILRGTNSRNAFIDTSNAQKWIGSFSDEDNRTAITKNVYGENVQGRPIVDLQLTNHLGVSKKYNLNAELIGIDANNNSETLARQSGDGFIRAEQASNQPANETTFKYTMGYDSLIASGSTSKNGFNLYPDFRASVMGKGSVQSRDYTDGDINISSPDQWVNQTAGVSITKWTASGSDQTIGHGLGAKPDFIIRRARNRTEDWEVYHGAFESTLPGGFQGLNTTAAYNDSATTLFTSVSNTTFGVGTDFGVNGGFNYITYAFKEVQGYSKFDKYVGNGNSNGVFVYTGFAPAWVMIKDTSQATNWEMYDVKRNPGNVRNLKLGANLNVAENGSDLGNTSQNNIDILSNGFKMRTSNTDTNVDGDTYVNMAFAENPFVTSTGIPTTAR